MKGKWNRNERKMEGKWKENEWKWKENEWKWKENGRKWMENGRKWNENERKWKENEWKWKENGRKWKENEWKWKENKWKGKENEWKWEENEWKGKENECFPTSFCMTRPQNRRFVRGFRRFSSHVTNCHACDGICNLAPLCAALTMRFAKKHATWSCKMMQIYCACHTKWTWTR